MRLVDVSIVNRGPLVGRTTVPGTKFRTSLNGASFFS